ncbi:probable peptidylglycine alpha-hydroxylating monooxygenase 1 [Gigantopelta aegis]|uniref:probable peptidylglycine alpha-hydroxylating monooxygenase 1 n=1 Tax=Gigantopelta aegis TaxID=1735272 RepID=UPI001B88D89C|nr:probable peptidylglycine alpha-hydroxylating monooxygenase 1 [Gigantopelta aegis]
MLALLVLLGFTSVSLAAPAGSSDVPAKVDLLMPDVQPKLPDTYLCHKIKLDSTDTYITGFVPNADMNIAHHMLLYGCLEPGSDKNVWNCGEMAAPNPLFESAPTCKSGPKIIYAWAMDAPSLVLPKDVAFKVGGHTDIKYIVLQVHYKNVTKFLNGGKDRSGITLQTTKKSLPRGAGVYLLGTMGSIPAHSTVYMETACPFPGKNLVIHPFAYRTHAHTLGRVVSGYRIRDGKWAEVGRMDPRKPEMFYNATTPHMTVKKGDILAARCTMENGLDHDVAIGATQKDEMCNFYIMYWVEGDHILDKSYCFSPGPPTWYWADFKGGDINLAARPKDISTIPGTDKPLVATETEKFGEMAAEDNAEQEEDVALESLLDQLGADELGSILGDMEDRRPQRREEDDEYYYGYDNN